MCSFSKVPEDLVSIDLSLNLIALLVLFDKLANSPFQLLDFWLVPVGSNSMTMHSCTTSKELAYILGLQSYRHDLCLEFDWSFTDN